MNDATKQKFLVLYLVPAPVMADWAKTDLSIRQPEEQKMQAGWRKWMGEHGNMVISTEAGGTTKRVTASGGFRHQKRHHFVFVCRSRIPGCGGEDLRKSPASPNSAIIN